MANAIATLPVDITANLDGLTSGMNAAARQVETSTAQMNRAVATVARTGDTFDRVEGKVKALGRTFSDARGALELFGAGGAAAAGALSPIAGAVGNIADAFGSLASVFRGGAAGLGLSAIVPVLGAVVTAATAAYGAYRYFASSSDEAATANKKLEEAIKLAESRMETAEALSKRLAEAKRQEAIATLRNAEAIQQETLAGIQADQAFAAEGAAEAQRQAANPGRRGTLRQNTARTAAEAAPGVLDELAAAARQAEAQLALTQARLQALLNPSADERATASRGGSGATGAVNALEDSLNRLAESAGQVRIPTDQLNEAAQLMEQLRTPTEIYADRMARLNILLESGALNQETFNRAAAAAQATLDGVQTRVEGVSKAYTGYGDAISTAFGEAIFRGRSLIDVLNNLAQTLAQQVFRQTIGNTLANATSSLIGNVFGSSGKPGLFSGMFGSGLTPAPGKLVLDGGVKMFAGGGRPPVGVPSIVGEAGPEWFVPDRAGTVLPSGTVPLAGTTYAPVISIDARHSRLSAAEIRGIIDAANAEVMARIPDQARRGGGWSRSVRGR